MNGDVFYENEKAVQRKAEIVQVAKHKMYSGAKFCDECGHSLQILLTKIGAIIGIIFMSLLIIVEIFAKKMSLTKLVGDIFRISYPFYGE